MTGITGVTPYNSYSNYTSIPKNPSGEAIGERITANRNGLDVGVDNVTSGKSATNIADGAMSGIADYVQRMRELAIKASNGLMSDDDRRIIQNEIEQNKQGIVGIAQNAKFNETRLLDGSVSNIGITTDGNGGKTSISGANATLEALGIKDFDVTKGDFDIKKLDDALQKVGGTRATIGAQSNALDHVTAYNQLASQNLSASMKDPLQIMVDNHSASQKQNLLNTYQMMMQKKDQDMQIHRAQSMFM